MVNINCPKSQKENKKNPEPEVYRIQKCFAFIL